MKIKNNKKEGFTLIELIAVIAIIIILSGAMYPKVIGYINEAKKLNVISQCRKVVIAAEAYNMRYNELDMKTKINDIISNEAINQYLESDELKNLNLKNTNLEDCYNIVNGAKFELQDGNKNALLDNSSIDMKESDKENMTGN